MESNSIQSETTDNTSFNIIFPDANKKNKSEQLSKTLLNNYMQYNLLIDNPMRKYSYEPKIYIKNFVPVIRPKITQKLIPTKLILNSKKNSSTLSQPSSDEENDISNEDLNSSNSFVNSVISDSSSDNNIDDNEINNVRKNFTKIRKYSIYRNRSKKNIKIKDTNDFNLNNNNSNIKKEKSESDEKDIKKTYISKKSYVILSSLQKNENIKIEKKPRNRINSFSILETLQNNLKIEK